MEIRTIGIDLGKTEFHLVGVNTRGEVVVRKKCSRTQLLRFGQRSPSSLQISSFWFWIGLCLCEISNNSHSLQLAKGHGDGAQRCAHGGQQAAENAHGQRKYDSHHEQVESDLERES